VGPSDRERRTPDDEKGLSGFAEGYRKAAPYLGASYALVAAIGLFAGLGYWLDKRMGNTTPWFLLLGSLLGMVGGFISFFRTVLGTTRKPK
jgi:ATP synthase protein I